MKYVINIDDCTDYPYLRKDYTTSHCWKSGLSGKKEDLFNVCPLKQMKLEEMTQSVEKVLIRCCNDCKHYNHCVCEKGLEMEIDDFTDLKYREKCECFEKDCGNYFNIFLIVIFAMLMIMMILGVRL